jgi:formylglycine-generating enzyme required for sulfatase activity
MSDSSLVAIESSIEFDFLTMDPRGQIQERRRHSTLCRVEPLDREVHLELVAIPPGKLWMGAAETEEGWHPSQAPQHLVSLAAFWISRYPITQAQWWVIATLPPIHRDLTPEPSCFAGADRPVEQVSWQDAVEFCARLSALTDQPYRLPSEAEWEYACRANPMQPGDPGPGKEGESGGTQTPFHFGETITTDLANYSGVNWELDGRICNKGFYGKGPEGCDRRETTDVGSFGVANQFGLYDMHGNVREWCADHWHPTYESAPTDGSAWIADGDPTQRVLRGGSWNGGPRTCRSAFRSRFQAMGGMYDIGFRVVCPRNGESAS